MNWALIDKFQILGKWWAYFQILAVIALIIFSMNLLDASLDQIQSNIERPEDFLCQKSY